MLPTPSPTPSPAPSSVALPPPARLHFRAGVGALLFYTLAIVYASLNPLIGWRVPGAFTLFSWPRYLDAFDIVFNVLAYIPFGGLLAALQLRSHRGVDRSPDPHGVWLRSVVAGGVLSLAMELLQSLLPLRVSSPVDVLANTAGAVIGTSLLVNKRGRQALARLLLWRHRVFAMRRETGWGLLLLGAWFFAQLNPLVPFFDGRQFTNPFDAAVAESAYDIKVLLPQALGIALNLGGFALLLSLLLHRRRRLLLNVLLILGAGFLLKLVMAAMMLRAAQLVEWLSPAAVIGVLVGLAAVAALASVRYRWRAFWATLLIFAGGLMSRITTVYGAVDETLRLFSWPQGHLASFVGLTRWVHDSWPLAACLFAAWIFVRQRGDRMTVSPDQ